MISTVCFFLFHQCLEAFALCTVAGLFQREQCAMHLVPSVSMCRLQPQELGVRLRSPSKAALPGLVCNWLPVYVDLRIVVLLTTEKLLLGDSYRKLWRSLVY